MSDEPKRLMPKEAADALVDLTDDDDDTEGPCVDGQEHDVVEIKPSTSTTVLFRYCRVCRAPL